jgi:ppGpp synthetase/RelA/SpoT-type nucleotidyltranferase
MMNISDRIAYQDLVQRRGEQYLRVLKTIRSLFENYQNYQAEGRRTIYRVASRADYQGFGQEFKKPKSVKEKIEQKKKDNEVYSLKDLEDIVGLRIVCLYPSDIETVAQYIRQLDERELLVISDEAKEYESGYRGHHFVVTLPDPALRDIKCEIQIVTVLLEAWACKTHPLTYKGMDKKLEHWKHARLLANALRVADEHSEFLKQLATRARELDEQRKNTARIRFASDIIPKVRIEESDEARKQANHIVEHIVKNEADLHYGEAYSTVIDQIHIYKNAYGITPGICRAAALLASLRENNDLDWFAMDFAQALVDNSQKYNPWYRHMKELICFCCGELDEAISEAKIELNEAETAGDTELALLSRNNISYYIAEIGDSSQAHYARDLIENVIKEDKRPEFLDTYGYVLIVFGQTEEEVKEGLSICCEACTKDPSLEVAKQFLKIHKMKAYERMLELLQE